MKITCASCKAVIEIKQNQLYHAGFSNLGFLYCDTCSNIFEFSAFNKHYVNIVGDKHPWTLNLKEKRRIESNLRPCTCGGRFRFDLKPRCPYCRERLDSIIIDEFHFVEIGDVVDGDKDDVWI